MEELLSTGAAVGPRQADAALGVPVSGWEMRICEPLGGAPGHNGRSAEAYQAADCQVGTQGQGDAGHELKGMA